jgi:hypothetical protein
MASEETLRSGKAQPERAVYEWKIRFEKQLRKDVEASESWKFLLDKSCSGGVLELCLFQIGFAGEGAAQLLAWETVHRIYNHQRATRIREAAEFILSIRDRYPSEISLQLSDAHGSLLKAVAGMDRMTDQRDFTRATYDYYLPLLAAYVLQVTGLCHFKHIAALVRCGCKADDPQGGYSADAVRNAVNRFRRANPPVWKAIKKAIQDWHESRSGVARDLLGGVFLILAYRPFGQVPVPKPKINVRDAEVAKRYLCAYEKSFPQYFWDIENEVIKKTIRNFRPPRSR